jgi:hypothetical protein
LAWWVQWVVRGRVGCCYLLHSGVLRRKDPASPRSGHVFFLGSQRFGDGCVGLLAQKFEIKIDSLKKKPPTHQLGLKNSQLIEVQDYTIGLEESMEYTHHF